MSDIIIGRQRGETYFIRERGTPNGTYDPGELHVRRASGQVERVEPSDVRPALERLGITRLSQGTRLPPLVRCLSHLRAAEAALRRRDFGRISRELRGAVDAAIEGDVPLDRHKTRHLFQESRQLVSEALEGTPAGPSGSRLRVALRMAQYDLEAFAQDHAWYAEASDMW